MYVKPTHHSPDDKSLKSIFTYMYMTKYGSTFIQYALLHVREITVKKLRQRLNIAGKRQPTCLNRITFTRMQFNAIYCILNALLYSTDTHIPLFYVYVCPLFTYIFDKSNPTLSIEMNEKFELDLKFKEPNIRYHIHRTWTRKWRTKIIKRR